MRKHTQNYNTLEAEAGGFGVQSYHGLDCHTEAIPGSIVRLCVRKKLKRKQ